MKQKVLIISYQFPPLCSSGVHRTLKFIRYLRDYDWEPVVLTAKPECYQDDLDNDLFSKVPAGVQVFRTPVVRIFDALSNLRKTASGKGDRTSPIEHKGGSAQNADGFLGKLKKFVVTMGTIPDNENGWLIHALPSARRITRDQDITAIYSTGQPWTAHLIAMLLKMVSSKPWVADFRDPWTLNPYRNRYPWVREGIERLLEAMVIRRADRVIANTKQLAHEFAKRYPQHQAKLVTITNGYDPADFDDLHPATNRSVNGRPLTLAHTGTFFRKRNPVNFLKGLSQSIERGLIPKDGIEVNFIGRGLDNFDIPNLIEELNLTDTVALCGYKPHPECLAAQRDSDVLLVIQPDTQLQVPAKLYEYVRIGRPTLALTVDGATSDLIRTHQLGYVADADNIDAICEALTELYQQYRLKALPTRLASNSVEEFDVRHLTGQLAEQLNEVSCRD